MSGCDTTSRPYSIGKTTALNHADQLRIPASVFYSQDSTKEDIKNAGEVALLVLYGTTNSFSLNQVRVDKFLHKVASSTVNTVCVTRETSSNNGWSIFSQLPCIPPSANLVRKQSASNRVGLGNVPKRLKANHINNASRSRTSAKNHQM